MYVEVQASQGTRPQTQRDTECCPEAGRVRQMYPEFALSPDPELLILPGSQGVGKPMELPRAQSWARKVENGQVAEGKGGEERMFKFQMVQRWELRKQCCNLSKDRQKTVKKQKRLNITA